MKILWITNIPSPYRVDFFNELGKNVDLEVIFERESSSERDSSWQKNDFKNFTPIFLKGQNIGVDFAISFQILKYIKKNKYDHIVVTNFVSPTGIIGIIKLILFKIPYIIESDGGFPKKNSLVKKMIKYISLTKAMKCLSTSKVHDEYYLSNGVELKNIIRYPFSSITRKDIIENINYKINMKNELKEELNIETEFMILSVGQFIERKGFEDLLNAFSNFKEDSSITLCMVGGEITPVYQKIINDKKIKNIKILNFLNKEDLKKIYLCSDLFVLPTLDDVWGLVINEAMANGLPIITTRQCLAGIEMIEDGKNGFLIDSKNPEELFIKMREIIANDVLRMNMANNNIDKIKNYTIDSMVEFHNNFFNEITNRR